jgi:hypothetical protein
LDGFFRISNRRVSVDAGHIITSVGEFIHEGYTHPSMVSGSASHRNGFRL